MPEFLDQTGRKVILPNIPKRIISLVPSQTELLFDLGLRNEIIGITKFCIHPEEWFHSKTRIGGTKQLNLEKIKALNPDLIIANKEENTKEQIEELMNDFSVWTSDVKTLDDALEMIDSIGKMVDKEGEAKNIIKQINNNFNILLKSSFKKVLYLIWKDPFMTINKDTFINDMIQRCGLDNVFSNRPDRYPEITIDDIIKANPELVLLPSEPYPFKEKHVQKIKNSIPNSTVILVNGEYFSWYGSRLIHAPKYFRKILHLKKNNI
jgi:ABC-type Fe3+-hydroxamate transport system substrate-binding protein